MTRLVLTLVLGAVVTACGLGCGGNKKSEPPKQEQPVINNPTDTGGSGKDKGKGGTGGSSTVQ